MRPIVPTLLALAIAAARVSAQQSITLDSVPLRASAGPGYLIVPTAQERGSARDVSELLAGRAAGLYVRRTGGEVGAGSRIYLRGPSHLTLPDRPLVVVDGVRAASAAVAPGAFAGVTATSPLDELDPEEVDSIRVLPGPAAAARYGPGAAAGALVVTTRRGYGSGFHAAGFARVGISRDAEDYPANYLRPGIYAGGVRAPCSLARQADGTCRPRADSLYSFNPLEQASPFRGGALWTVGARVEGGSGPVSYLASAARGSERGVLRDNGATRTDLHGRVALRLPRNLEVGASAAYLDRELAGLVPQNSILSPIAAALLGSARDDSLRGYAVPVAPFGTPFAKLTLDTRRARGVAWATWSPAPWARVEARYGIDRADRDGLERLSSGGQSARDSSTATQDLRDATASAWVRLAPLASLGWRMGAGVQRTGERTRSREVFRSPAGTAENSLGVRRSVVGAWLSQGLDWRGTVQVDALARRDHGSLGGDALWSASAAAGWTVSGEPFFPRAGWLDELRLRGSWGRIDALPSQEPDQGFPYGLFASCPGGGACALSPERNTEVEAGLEARLWRRLALGVTGYRRETARLVADVTAPLGGLLPLNLGTVRNTGVEATLRLDGIATGPARWELELLGATNRNRVTRFDGNLSSGDQRIFAGYPLGGYWARPIASFGDLNGDGVLRAGCVAGVCEVVLDTLSFVGAAQPGHMLAAAARVRWGPALTFAARLEHQGGYRLQDRLGEARCTPFAICREANDPSTPLAGQARVVAALMGSPAGFIHDASFTRLREVTVTLAAPAGWVRPLGAAVDLSLSGRNLATWTSYAGLDPEVNSAGPVGYPAFELGALPLPRTWTARLDVRF
ncbi:MAG TPA: TonB-dependent receptor plug domain-containing protein [Longimicrobium sp.]|jgi:hypothetical protein|nr:TonB-dependent receptor plug domain-containing protein [Longimicrobium sp.]